MWISPGPGVRILALVLVLITVQWCMCTEAKDAITQNLTTNRDGASQHLEDNLVSRLENISSENKNSKTAEDLQENLQDKNSQQDAMIQKLATSINRKLQNLEDKLRPTLEKIFFKTENLSAEVEDLRDNLKNCKNSQQEAMIQNLQATNINGRLQNLEEKLKENIFSTNKNLKARMKHLEENSEKQESIIQNQEAMIARLENNTFNGSALNSCKDILAADKSAVSGIYWIQLTTTRPFQVYCDMKTQGGGWTLVYSYTFTDYNNFRRGKNVVTPRPYWSAREANVPISTTPPLGESSRGAVDYSIWKKIGQEFMVKSNINDWLVCKPNGGSLVTQKRGPIICKNIKNVAPACEGVVPNRLNWSSYGPSLIGPSTYYYYYFKGYGNYYSRQWPTHDPCGGNNLYQKKGVSNPGGQIYLR